jgi:hypothetical protein
MEKIMYPLKNMWITCVPGQGLHKYSKAIDDQGKDYATIDNLYAPFTGKIVRTYPSENEIWFESLNKVEFADGTIDYATILFAHKNDISKLKDGTVVKQGEVVYSEGTRAGNSNTGAERHVHFEICAGKTTGSGWKAYPDGTWNLVNSKNPQDCYYIDDSINVIKTGGLIFKKTNSLKITSVVDRNENISQIKVIADELRVRVQSSTNGQVIGYAEKNGIYNDLEVCSDGTYTWHRIADNQWVADNGNWLELLPILNYKDMYEKEVKTNETLKEEINSLKSKLKDINKISTI